MNPLTSEIRTVGALENFLHAFRIGVECWIEIPPGAEKFLLSHGKLHERLLKAIAPNKKVADIKELRLPDSTPLNEEAIAIILEMKKENQEIGLTK